MNDRNNSDVQRVFHRLKKTFAEGKTRDLSYRKSQLRKLLDFLSDFENQICDALVEDLAKPRFETVIHEIGLVRVEVRHALSHLSRWSKPTRVKTPLVQFWSRSSYRFEPKGVTLIIGPWNFPIQLILGPLVGAIAAGNTAILKPSEFAKATSDLLAANLSKYLDEDSYAIITGDHEVSQQLLELPLDHIFFTGSTRVGSIVMQQAGKNLVPVTLELGGKSPCVIGSSTDIRLAAQRIAWGKFLNCGQVCLAPDFVFVPKKQSNIFIHELKNEIERAYTKDPKSSKDYGRLINQNHVARLKDLLADQQVIFGGANNAAEKYLEPTLVLNPMLDSPLMQEEIFGPILPILEYDSVKEFLEILSKMPRPLALYIFSSEKNEIETLRTKVASGAFCVNDVVSHVAVPDLPFGGVGASGIGNYHGKYSFETFSYKRAYFEKSMMIDMPFRYPPFSDFYEKIARFFMR